MVDNSANKDYNSKKEENNKKEDSHARRNEEKRRNIRSIREWLDGRRLDGTLPEPYKRRSGDGSQNGLVTNVIEPTEELKELFNKSDLPIPIFHQLKKNNPEAMEKFKNSISKAKQSLGNFGVSVDVYEDYTDINLYLSEDEDSGFAVKPDGDIVSVFSNSKEQGRSHYMLELAINEGGRKLDCFDIYLTKIYDVHGFKAVARTKWNEEYKPEGWDKETFKAFNNGEPDVVYMVYDPEHKESYKTFTFQYG